MNVFILAAGLGERLRPITLQLPKPLLPILGKPILEFVLESVCAVNPSNIAINLHYKADMIMQWLQGAMTDRKIITYYEHNLLGTGGALKNARDILASEESFIVYNADVFCEYPLKNLIKAHDSLRYIATLLVVDYPPVNTLYVSNDGLLQLQDRHPSVRRTFTGIALYSSRFLDYLPNGYSSVVDGWRRAIEEGHRINTLDITDSYWSDIGSFNSYADTVFHYLTKDGEQVYIDNTFEDCPLVNYGSFVVIEEGCGVALPIGLKNTIVMPKTQIEEQLDFSDVIIGNGYLIRITPKLPNSLGSGGSDRSFQRVTNDGLSVVVMNCKKEDPDFIRHVEYTVFFSAKGIAVPKVLSYDREGYQAVFEDLGDLSLYNWLRCKRDEDAIVSVYEAVIKEIIELHGIDLGLEANPPAFRTFDYDYFLWETAYFLENYVGLIRGIHEIDEAIKDELRRLARDASSLRKTLIHRDLQSQNIILKDGRPHLIDYQGARLGPPAYDVASLCYDPYVDLSDDMRDYLCGIYISKASQRGDFDRDCFIKSISICKKQRLMQALGAYGFLSVKRRKDYFKKHIPNALRLLKETFKDAVEDYPLLSNFIQQL